mmetsp:Transcript_51270/g.130326  ORF Transcript_51270/g.130326 Transcript_51270/m.130326 type:complete len:200 (-) Transcript_51270:494-1093(-)
MRPDEGHGTGLHTADNVLQGAAPEVEVAAAWGGLNRLEVRLVRLQQRSIIFTHRREGRALATAVQGRDLQVQPLAQRLNLCVPQNRPQQDHSMLLKCPDRGLGLCHAKAEGICRRLGLPGQHQRHQATNITTIRLVGLGHVVHAPQGRTRFLVLLGLFQVTSLPPTLHQRPVEVLPPPSGVAFPRCLCCSTSALGNQKV